MYVCLYGFWCGTDIGVLKNDSIGRQRVSSPSRHRLSVVAVHRVAALPSMQHGRFAASGATTPDKKNTALGAADFPQFPGEDFLAHAATQFKEQAEARLAARSLLTRHPRTD